MNLLKRDFAVNLALNVWQRIPAPVVHNLSKAQMLKLIFWHLNVDQRPGFYMEFGVAHGHSMKAAILASRFSNSRQLGVQSMKRSFFGVDTFETFMSSNPIDIHPVWKSDKFTKSLDQVKHRFRKEKVPISFLKIDASRLDKESPQSSEFKKSLIGRAAILLFDMDLYEPTKSALNWANEFIDEGTFLMFDEFFAFNGSQEKGEAKAFLEYSHQNPNLVFRDFATYGSGGKVFIVSKPIDAQTK